MSSNSNPNNVSLQTMLLTMMIEKIDNLANRIGEMQLSSREIQQSFDALSDRVGALEGAIKKASSAKEKRAPEHVEKKKEPEAKPQDITDAQKPLFGATPSAPPPAKTQDQSSESKPVESREIQQSCDTLSGRVVASEEKEALTPKKKKAFVPVVEAKKEAEVKTQGFGDRFNKKAGEWDCTICYVVNKPSENVCVSCGTGKDGIEKSAAAPSFKPTNFAPAANTSFSFGVTNAQKPLFGVTPAVSSPAKAQTFSAANTSFGFGATKAQKPSFAVKPSAPSPAKTEAPSTESKPAESKSLFGTTKPITFSFAPPQSATPTSSPFATPATGSPFGAKNDGTQTKSLFGGPTSSSVNKTPLSLSSFASGTSFLDKKTDSTNNSFGAIGSCTFAKNANAAEAEKEHENPEEYVPDVHYEPVVPLPDKVDVVTGEESEQVLFKNRCKLYIFNSETKEVKERGIGDIKVLHDPAKKTYRVVMRREQVHKICANFRITRGMNVADKTGNNGVGIFSCIDFSENTESGTSTVFYVRFREEAVYDEFKILFNEISGGFHATQVESLPNLTTDSIPEASSVAFSFPELVDSFVDQEEEEGDDEEEYEDYYCDEPEVLFESECNLILGEPQKSIFSKTSSQDVEENVKLVISVVDEEGIYEVAFKNGENEKIFPHYIENDSNYQRDCNKISFVARDRNLIQKSVSCEFKDLAAAAKAYGILKQCRDSNVFAGYD